jgi:hypothetical protein
MVTVARGIRCLAAATYLATSSAATARVTATKGPIAKTNGSKRPMSTWPTPRSGSTIRQTFLIALVG